MSGLPPTVDSKISKIFPGHVIVWVQAPVAGCEQALTAEAGLI